MSKSRIKRPFGPSKARTAKDGKSIWAPAPPVDLLISALPGGAKLLFQLMCVYADKTGEACVGLTRLSDDLHVSYSTVRRLMLTLTKAKLVTVTGTQPKAQTNIYQVLLDREEISAALISAGLVGQGVVTGEQLVRDNAPLGE